MIHPDMLYKVTPALAPVPRRASSGSEARPKKRRASAVFDSDGHEVLISLMCLKCHQIRPLAQFGLRRMPDGAVRNQPWCRTCRGAVTPKKKPAPPGPPAPIVESAATSAPPAAPTPSGETGNDPG